MTTLDSRDAIHTPLQANHIWAYTKLGDAFLRVKQTLNCCVMRRPLLLHSCWLLAALAPSQGITTHRESLSNPAPPRPDRAQLRGLQTQCSWLHSATWNNGTFTNPFQWGLYPRVHFLSCLSFHHLHLCYVQDAHWNMCCCADIIYLYIEIFIYF